MEDTIFFLDHGGYYTWHQGELATVRMFWRWWWMIWYTIFGSKLYISVPKLYIYSAIMGGQVWQEFTPAWDLFLLALISCGAILSKTAI
jgi:hypothetical protein